MEAQVREDGRTDDALPGADGVPPYHPHRVPHLGERDRRALGGDGGWGVERHCVVIGEPRDGTVVHLIVCQPRVRAHDPNRVIVSMWGGATIPIRNRRRSGRCWSQARNRLSPPALRAARGTSASRPVVGAGGEREDDSAAFLDS